MLGVGIPLGPVLLAWPVRSIRVQAKGIWWVTLMSLGRSLRTICAVSGSSVRGTVFGKLKELVEDVEWKVAMEDMSCMCAFMFALL